MHDGGLRSSKVVKLFMDQSNVLIVYNWHTKMV